MHLFLDFDGVLHPKGAAQPRFVRLNDFEACMRKEAMRAVQIVISSTWRVAYSLEQLRGFFASDIAARIVGTTSTLRSYVTEYERGEEIQAWLKQNAVTRWVALDDDVEGFARNLRSHLILCDGTVGFSAAQARMLTDYVQSHL